MPGTSDTPIGSTSFRVVVAWAKSSLELGLCWMSPPESRHVAAAADGTKAADVLSTVTLRRALTGGSELFEWRRDAVAMGDKAKRTVTVDLLAVPGGDPVATWRLDGALPVRWTGTSLDALAGRRAAAPGDPLAGIALEELELAYDAVTWLVPGQRVDPKSPRTIPPPPSLAAGPLGGPVADSGLAGGLGTTPLKPPRPTG